jgi:hypothetical protein
MAVRQIAPSPGAGRGAGMDIAGQVDESEGEEDSGSGASRCHGRSECPNGRRRAASLEQEAVRQACSLRLLDLPVGLESLQLPIERLAVEAENPGGQGLVAPYRLQNMQDVTPLDVFHRDQLLRVL